MIGWIPGRDSSRALVIGAHYDQLGFGAEGSLAPVRNTSTAFNEKLQNFFVPRCAEPPSKSMPTAKLCIDVPFI